MKDERWILCCCSSNDKIPPTISMNSTCNLTCEFCCGIHWHQNCCFGCAKRRQQSRIKNANSHLLIRAHQGRKFHLLRHQAKANLQLSRTWKNTIKHDIILTYWAFLMIPVTSPERSLWRPPWTWPVPGRRRFSWSHYFLRRNQSTAGHWGSSRWLAPSRGAECWRLDPISCRIGRASGTERCELNWRALWDSFCPTRNKAVQFERSGS